MGSATLGWDKFQKSKMEGSPNAHHPIYKDNNVFQNIFDTFVRFKPQEQNAWSWNSLQSKIKVTNSFERADEEVNENFLAP